MHPRWLDKLGLSARLGHEVVIRQTFVGGSYALLDDDLDPNPVSTIYLSSIPIMAKHRAARYFFTQIHTNRYQ